MEMKNSNTNELEILDEEDPFGDVTTPFDNVVFSNAENGVTTQELSDKDIIIESSDDEVMQKCDRFLKNLSETLPFNDSLSAPQVSKTKVKSPLGVQDDKDKDEDFVSSPKGITKSLRAIRPYTEENLNKIDDIISLPGSSSSEKTPDKNDDKTNSRAETVCNENHDIGSDDEHSGEQTPASNRLSRNKEQRDEHSRGENPNSCKNSGKDKSDSETSRAPSPASMKNSRSEARHSGSRSPSSENPEKSRSRSRSGSHSSENPEKEEIVLDDSETSESESEDSEEEDEESAEAQERWEKRNTVEYSEREDKYYRKNKKTLEKQLAGKMTSCTSCCCQVSHYVKSDIYTHPVLGVLLCKKCAKFYGKGEFKKDADGYDEYCRWCANGGDLLLCDNCTTGFCKNCIKRNLGRSALKEVTDSKTWKCYTCFLKPLVELRALQRTILEGLRIASSPRKGRKSLEKEPIKKRTKKTPMKKKKVQTVDESSDLTHAEDLKILLITFKNQLKVIEKRTKAKRGEEAKVKLHRRLLRLIYLMQQNFTRVRNEIVKEFGDIAEGDQINATNTKDDASKKDEDGEKPANEEEQTKTVKSVTRDSSENNKIYGRMRKRKLDFEEDEEEEERSSAPLKKQKVQNDESEKEASSNDQGIVEKEMSSKGKNMKRTSISHNDSPLEKEANKSSNYSQKQTPKKANANISDDDSDISEKEVNKSSNPRKTKESISDDDADIPEKEANKSSNHPRKKISKKAKASINDNDSDISENEANTSSNPRKAKASINDDDLDISEKEANKSSNHSRKRTQKKAKERVSDDDSDIPEKEANKSSNYSRKQTPKKANASTCDDDSDVPENEVNKSSNPRKANINDNDSGISKKEANKSSNHSRKRSQQKAKERVSDDDSDIPEKEENKSSNYSRKQTPKKANASTCDDKSDVPEKVNKSSNPRNTKANISDDDSDISEKEVNKSSIYSRKQTAKKANASISDDDSDIPEKEVNKSSKTRKAKASISDDDSDIPEKEVNKSSNHPRKQIPKKEKAGISDDSDIPERETNKSFNFRKQTPKKTKEQNEKRNFSKGDSEAEEKSEKSEDESATDESSSKTTSNLPTRRRSNSVEGKFSRPVLKRAVISLTPVQVTQMNIENSSEGKILDGKSGVESEDSMSSGVNGYNEDRSVKGSNNIRTSNKIDSPEEKKVKTNKRKSGNREKDEDKRERERTSMFRDRVPESNDSGRKMTRQQDVITLDSDSDSSSNDSYDAKPKKESKSPQSKSKKSPQNKTPVNSRKSNGLKIKATGFFGNNRRNSTEANGTVVSKKRGRSKASGGTNKRMKTAMVTLEKEVFTLVANKTKAKTSPAKHKNPRSKSPKVHSPRTKV